MNSTTTADRRVTVHPPDTAATPRRRRVGLVDRLALRLGVALITWSRRSYKAPPTREELTLLREQQRELEARERALERMLLLHP